MPYGTHTQEDIISFLNRGSDTAKVFKKILLYRVNSLIENNYKPLTYEAIPWILEHVSSEEMSFEAGVYKNSGWSQKNKEIESFPGKKWEGFVGVFRWEGYELVLYKENCLNFLYVETSSAPAPKAETKDDDLPFNSPKEEKKDNRTLVGGWLISQGTEYNFTESQARFFYFQNQEDMRAEAWRPEGRSKNCCVGGLDYSKFIFASNEPRGKGHGGKKKYYGHR